MWMVFDAGSKLVEDRAIESLGLSVGLKFVGFCERIIGVKDETDVLEELGSILRSGVGEHFGRWAEIEYPMFDEELGNFAGRHSFQCTGLH